MLLSPRFWVVLWLVPTVEYGVCWTIRQFRCSWHFLSGDPTGCNWAWEMNYNKINGSNRYLHQLISFNQVCNILPKSTLLSLRRIWSRPPFFKCLQGGIQGIFRRILLFTDFKSWCYYIPCGAPHFLLWRPIARNPMKWSSPTASEIQLSHVQTMDLVHKSNKCRTQVRWIVARW